MIPQLRQQYNQAFTAEKYKGYIHGLEELFSGALDFRVAETPVFVPHSFLQQMIDACEAILDVITSPGYIQKSEAAIPPRLKVPGPEGQPQFICFDFGVCTAPNGGFEPQLIELQAFPTLFAWHLLKPQIWAAHFPLPEGFSPFIPPFNAESYTELLRRIILGAGPAEETVLLELFPHQQKTRVDFYATESLLGIPVVCVTEIVQQENKLFYTKNGTLQPIKRIYNRVIFDELLLQPEEVQQKAAFFQQPLEVTWVPHPNWFYRISKFALPFVQHPQVPETKFLSDLQSIPPDLENYVIKPLFSFAGQGVIIDVTPDDIAQINDPHNWIIQRKVSYAPAIATPGEPAKAEIRLFYFWEPGAQRPVAVNNLARLSKGKMVGTRYNKDKEWVGGTFCLFEQPVNNRP
jgi:hypothetical protein